MAGHVLVGYGEGESMAAARADASREIAEALRVSVHSTGEVVAERDASGSEVSSQFRVALTSRVILSDLSTVKQARRSGRCYVALGYDNRTLFQKLGSASGRSANGMSSTPMGFKESLPFSHNLTLVGIFPADYRVVRRHGGWSLVVDGATYPITFETWFRQLFIERAENEGLSLDVTPQGPLPSGSHYQVHVTPPRLGGYLNLFHVSESGQALALLANRHVESLQPVQVPDASLYAGLEAIVTAGHGSRDMLLATWSPEAVNSSESHAPVSPSPLAETDERAFSYGELLEQVNGLLWASHFVWIQNR
ncbi:hypothetical protein DSLASN_42150 [Desulfoluna limicola]|uniref:Uncharacterized protein n=1 Tax=Desulfoluna limicola TaxID=2810562 RepID=A0ABM7PM36_9BACT|nr:hypothetical protein DSLASN_42150 [Desulfoluna limicola]